MSGNQAVLIFDLGNVLVKLNPVTGFWPQIIPDSQEAARQEELWSASRASRAFETGRIKDYRQLYDELRAELNIDISWQEFQLVYENIIGDLFPETLPLLETLAGRYELFLLSNTSPVHWRRCREEQGLGRFFTRTFLSYEIGYMKPDANIYQAVLDYLGPNEVDLIYFDDRRENILAGAKLGFCACQTMGGLELAEKLKRLGIIDSYPYRGP